MPKPIKYSRFREIVKNLINDHYRFEASESEMMDFESKLIEYAADGHYDICVSVACYDLAEYFKMTSEDLLRFVRKPRAVVKIEKLRLYTMANETFSSIYYEVREPDEYGNYPECPEISKEFLISSKLFRIRKKDLPDLLEDIKADDPFDLKAKQGEVKERDTTTSIAQAPIETPLSYNKITGKFRYGDSESIPISKSSRHKVRQQAEKLMKWWKEGKPCPQSEIVRDPIKKIPRSVYDNTSTIRKTLLEYLKVNMPQCANDEYPPPSEPKHFKTVS